MCDGVSITAVLSPVLTSPLITSPANVSSASRIREYNFIDGLDGNVGLDRTPPGVRSPVAHPTVDDLLREYDFIDGLDGDVGLDRTPPGVRSPVAHPTVDDSSLVDGVMRKPTAMTLHKTT